MVRLMAIGVRRRNRLLFILIAWEIWKERNARCFRGANTQLSAVKDTIRRQAERWIFAEPRVETSSTENKLDE